MGQTSQRHHRATTKQKSTWLGDIVTLGAGEGDAASWGGSSISSLSSTPPPDCPAAADLCSSSWITRSKQIYKSEHLNYVPEGHSARQGKIISTKRMTLLKSDVNMRIVRPVRPGSRSATARNHPNCSNSVTDRDRCRIQAVGIVWDNLRTAPDSPRQQPTGIPVGCWSWAGKALCRYNHVPSGLPMCKIIVLYLTTECEWSLFQRFCCFIHVARLEKRRKLGSGWVESRNRPNKEILVPDWLITSHVT